MIKNHNRFYKIVGRNIEKYRVQKGITQESLGKILSLSRCNISNIECGRQAIMLPHLYNISKVLDIPIRQFLP